MKVSGRLLKSALVVLGMALVLSSPSVAGAATAGEDPATPVAAASSASESNGGPARLDQAGEPVDQVVDAAGSEVVSRPDSVSAVQVARVSGERVEDLSQRTPYVRVFANPDGSWTNSMSQGAMSVETAGGGWVPVDPTLERVDGGGFSPKDAVHPLVFSGGGTGPLVRMSVDGRDVRWRWPSALPAPVVEGNSATYRAVLPHGDLVVYATGDGFSHQVVLREAPRAPLVITMPVVTEDSTLKQSPDGDLKIKADDGSEVLYAEAPVMWDSSTESEPISPDGPPSATSSPSPAMQRSEVPGEGARVVDLAASVKPAVMPGVEKLVLRPDMGFLTNPETQYPVVIDPSWSSNPAYDTWITSQGGGGRLNDDQLKVGKMADGFKARTFLQFTNIPAGATIYDAVLWLRNHYSYNCAAHAIYASRVTSGWGPGAAIGWPGPSVDGFGQGLYQPAHGSTNCGVDWAWWDLTAMVQSWSSGAANHGVRLHAGDESVASSLRNYRSMEYGDPNLRPRLDISYNHAPSQPGGVAISSFGQGYVTDPSPVLSADLADPDGGLVAGNFSIVPASGGAPVWSGSEGWYPSGTRVYVRVPAGLLADGAYQLRVRTSDGIVESSTAVVGFTYDATKPAVVVESNSFDLGRWIPAAPMETPGFRFVGSPDIAAFEIKRDGVVAPSKPRDPNNSGVTLYEPTDWPQPATGWHTLEVTPVDQAGNRGPTRKVEFGIAGPGLMAPYPNQGTVGPLRVDARGLPGAATLKLQWRNKASDVWQAAGGVKRGSQTGTAFDDSTVDQSGGYSSPGVLSWDITQPGGTAGPTLSAPTQIEIRACFSGGTTTVEQCTPATPVQVDDGLGAEFPIVDAGPVKIAAATGVVGLSETDAALAGAGFARSWNSSTTSANAAGPFGYGWTAQAVTPGSSEMKVLDQRSVNDTIVLAAPEGGDVTFAYAGQDDDAQTVDYLPTDPAAAANTRLVVDTSTTPQRLRLIEDADTTTKTTTVWMWNADASDPTKPEEKWQLEKAVGPDLSASVISTPATGTTRAKVTWIGQTPTGGTGGVCNATTQSNGCAGLQVKYEDAAHPERVTAVWQKSVPLNGGAAINKQVVSYSYTGDLLTLVCGPAPATGEAALCTQYSYDPVGNGYRLAGVTPAGQTPWQITYDGTSVGAKATGSERAYPSSTNGGGGDATGVIKRDLSLGDNAIPQINATTAKDWEQTIAPTKVYAVYGPGADTGDVSQAGLVYVGEDGNITNTAAWGTDSWAVNTTWKDQYGHIVRTLDGDGWLRAKAAPAVERVAVAADYSSFSFYNRRGTRVQDSYGPVRTTTLRNGSTGEYRPRTQYTYDNERLDLGGGDKPDTSPLGGPNASPIFDLVVQTRTGPSRVDMKGWVGDDGDVSETRYDYAPQVVGDGNGWKLAKPIRTLTRTAGPDNWTGPAITSARYDNAGRVIETRGLGATGDDARTTLTRYYTTGTNSDPDCGNKPEFEALLCKTLPAGQPSSKPIPVTWIKSYNDLDQPLVKTETSGATVRTTTTTYDELGRVRTTNMTVTGGEAADDNTLASTITYGPQGTPTSVSSGGDTMTTNYDAWGRVVSNTDANGTQSTTTYTPRGSVASVNDGTGPGSTYGYSYDNHGSLTKVEPGGGIGSFTYTYDTYGNPTQIGLPNGGKTTRTFDQAGNLLTTTHTAQDNTAITAYSVTRDINGRILKHTGPAATENYDYDKLGRLTKATGNWGWFGCHTRTYSFDTASNRTNRTYYEPGTNGACQTTTPKAVSPHTYDTVGRPTDAGYTYDNLGRTRTLPAIDTNANQGAAPSPLSLTYAADDMVKSMTQTANTGWWGATEKWTTNYTLDPARRVKQITRALNTNPTSTTTTYRYAGAADAPAGVETMRTGNTIPEKTRYISVPTLGMAATITTPAANNGATPGPAAAKLQLADTRGNTVAVMPATVGSKTLDSTTLTDEYGNPITGPTDRYQWLGTHQRATGPDTIAGLTLMGARLYNPQTGLFTSPDPIPGGNTTPYTYPQDPLNQTDLDGLCGKINGLSDFCNLGVALGKGVYKVGKAASKGIKSLTNRGAKPATKVPSVMPKSSPGAAAGAKAGVPSAPRVLKGPLPDAVPRNLNEQLALKAAKSGAGRRIMDELADEPRLIANYGKGNWVKKEYVMRGASSKVTVHYFHNPSTGKNVEFKFK